MADLDHGALVLAWVSFAAVACNKVFMSKTAEMGIISDGATVMGRTNDVWPIPLLIWPSSQLLVKRIPPSAGLCGFLSWAKCIFIVRLPQKSVLSVSTMYGGCDRLDRPMCTGMYVGG